MLQGWGEGPRLLAQDELQRLVQHQIAAQISREEKDWREAWLAWLAGEWGTCPRAV